MEGAISVALISESFVKSTKTKNYGKEKNSGNQPEFIHQSKNEQSLSPQKETYTVVIVMGLSQIGFQDFQYPK